MYLPPLSSAKWLIESSVYSRLLITDFVTFYSATSCLNILCWLADLIRRRFLELLFGISKFNLVYICTPNRFYVCVLTTLDFLEKTVISECIRLITFFEPPENCLLLLDERWINLLFSPVILTPFIGFYWASEMVSSVICFTLSVST